MIDSGIQTNIIYFILYCIIFHEDIFHSIVYDIIAFFLI